MENKIDYIQEEGTRDCGNVTIYALSTCGFCRMAMDFLKANSIKFRYVYMDELDYNVRVSIKSELERTYKKSIAYPFMVLENDECTVGFVKGVWESVLNI